jgi:quinoprotein glucose dehydrogenase
VSAPSIREADSWGATLIDQLMCRIEYKSLRYDGPMTAPSLQGSLTYPAYFGLSDWAGASVDPGRGLAFLNLSYLPWVVRLVPRDEALQKNFVLRWDGKSKIPADVRPGVFPQYGTPYVAQIRAWLSPAGVPCLQPPLGEMAAMDLRTKKFLWKRSYGTARHSGPLGFANPLPLPTGIYTEGVPSPLLAAWCSWPVAWIANFARWMPALAPNCGARTCPRRAPPPPLPIWARMDGSMW